jgi:hypothetical protein
VALLFDEHPPTGEQLHRAGDDLVQHRPRRLVGWCGHFDNYRFTVGTAPVHAVQHQAVQMELQVGRPAETLDQSHHAAVGLALA